MTQQELDALKALANAATRYDVRRIAHHVYRVDAEGELQSHATFVSGTDDAAWYAAAREAVPALLDALAAANARAEAAERRAMVAERRLAAGPAAVALKHIDDYGRAQWVNGREAKFRISYAEWWKLMVELGEVQP